MIWCRLLCILTLLLSVATICALAETISPDPEKEPAACTEDSERSDGECHNRSPSAVQPHQGPQAPPLQTRESDTSPSCETGTGDTTVDSCTASTTSAPGHQGGGISNHGSGSGAGVGAEESVNQERLNQEQKQQQQDTLSGQHGSSTSRDPSVSQPSVPGSGGEDGRQENGNSVDQGMRTEGSTTRPVGIGETDHTNGTQQPEGNGVQSPSQSSGAANTDSPDSQSTHSGTTEQPQSSDNNQTSQEPNGAAENSNAVTKPAEDDSTNGTESTTNNEDSTTTTTTTTLPPELTNNKKGDADSSSSISRSVWVRVPLLIVVTLACILVC
ncbi:uncharacterized protein TM35_000501010 [Trypanosoma theileri]|uniref:Mucin TcMUCII n=1 Tax=Trypanosoma theileri TaxID=67003 RepID=A0A1X0NHC2_9TRYP|nr:uncharacterized protein TM35_000501010 [Trypanosoma theileri]ORC84047.1 hypothetical protein TM35_000501010 [Trypanosoma theileri]